MKRDNKEIKYDDKEVRKKRRRIVGNKKELGGKGMRQLSFGKGEIKDAEQKRENEREGKYKRFRNREMREGELDGELKKKRKEGNRF